MASNPQQLKPGEFCQLLNSTSLGEVMTESQLRRLRNQAGPRIGSGTTIDLLKYTGWQLSRRHGNEVRSKSRSPTPELGMIRLDTAPAATASVRGLLRNRRQVALIEALLTESTYTRAAAIGSRPVSNHGARIETTTQAPEVKFGFVAP